MYNNTDRVNEHSERERAKQKIFGILRDLLFFSLVSFGLYGYSFTFRSLLLFTLSPHSDMCARNLWMARRRLRLRTRRLRRRRRCRRRCRTQMNTESTYINFYLFLTDRKRRVWFSICCCYCADLVCGKMVCFGWRREAVAEAAQLERATLFRYIFYFELLSHLSHHPILAYISICTVLHTGTISHTRGAHPTTHYSLRTHNKRIRTFTHPVGSDDEQTMHDTHSSHYHDQPTRQEKEEDTLRQRPKKKIVTLSIRYSILVHFFFSSWVCGSPPLYSVSVFFYSTPRFTNSWKKCFQFFFFFWFVIDSNAMSRFLFSVSILHSYCNRNRKYIFRIKKNESESRLCVYF